GGAVDQHAQQMRNIDLAERRDLNALGARRNSLSARISGLIQGQGHFDRDEQKIVDRHEAARMTKHRDLEALKDRQFQAAQETRLRQARERKAIFDTHRNERRDLVQAHAKDRPRRIELQQQLQSYPGNL